MAKRPLNEAERWDYRVGKGGFSYNGMMVDPEPGTNPPNHPRLIVNGRFQGGGIVSRPPYIPKFAIGPNYNYSYSDPTLQTRGEEKWQPKWMEAHNPQKPKELWYGYFSATDGAVIKRTAWEGDTQATTIAKFPTLINRASPACRYNGSIFVGDQNHLKKIFRAGDDGAGSNVALGSLPLDETLYTFPNSGGSTRKVSVLFPHSDGRLYILVDDLALVANTIVYSFDGSQIVEELDMGSAYAGGSAFCEVSGKLAFIANQGLMDSTLYLKSLSGAWGTVAASGTGGPPNQAAFEGWINGMASLGSKLWIGCGDNGWFLYDDETGVFQKRLSVTGALVGTTISDRVFLTYNNGTGAKGYVRCTNKDETYAIDTVWTTGPALTTIYATAIGAVGRRLQIAGNASGSPRQTSYGTPGSAQLDGLKLAAVSALGSSGPIEYFVEI